MVVRPGRKTGTRRGVRRERVAIAWVGCAGSGGRAAVVAAAAVEEDILQTVSIVIGQ